LIIGRWNEREAFSSPHAPVSSGRLTQLCQVITEGGWHRCVGRRPVFFVSREDRRPVPLRASQSAEMGRAVSTRYLPFVGVKNPVTLPDSENVLRASTRSSR